MFAKETWRLNRNSGGAGVADFDESFDKETTKPDDYAASINNIRYFILFIYENRDELR